MGTSIPALVVRDAQFSDDGVGVHRFRDTSGTCTGLEALIERPGRHLPTDANELAKTHLTRA